MRFLLYGILAGGLVLTPAARAVSASAEAQKSTAQQERDMTGWEWANFLMLAAVLAYFGVKMGKPYFAGQTKLIGNGLDEAKRRRSQAERRSQEVQLKLDHLGADIEGFRASVLTEQAVQVERMRKQIETELQRVQVSASQQIESVGKHARLDLQRYASRLALDLAEIRVRERMNPGLQDELAGQFVENLRD